MSQTDKQTNQWTTIPAGRGTASGKYTNLKRYMFVQLDVRNTCLLVYINQSEPVTTPLTPPVQYGDNQYISLIRFSYTSIYTLLMQS